MAVDEIGRGDDAAASPEPFSGRQADQASVAHQYPDLVVADNHAANEAEFGMHARRPIGATRRGVDLGDQVGEPDIADRSRRKRTISPRVETRGGDLKAPTCRLDRLASPAITAIASNLHLGQNAKTELEFGPEAIRLVRV